MRAQGWRQYLLAVLLAASLAHVYGDAGKLTDESRSGANLDSDESRTEEGGAKELEEVLANLATATPAPEIDDDNRRKIPLEENPKDVGDLLPSEIDILLPPKEDHQPINIIPTKEDQPILPEDPIVEPRQADKENAYPFTGNLTGSGYGGPPSSNNRPLSRLIPPAEQVLLQNIPGAENSIYCSREGELHNIWAPGYQCMVCVCQPTYGQLRPVCVSCRSCLVPPPGPTTPWPWTTTSPAPTEPPTQPPPPPSVSCKPLPVGIPVQSPLDPCKICTCTESVDQWGRPDVKITCQFNSQCVLPSTTTPQTPNTTPVPSNVCDKFPADVPFPHPHDACKLCKCVLTYDSSGLPIKTVLCYDNQECHSTTPHEGSTQLPDTEICDRYPIDTFFPNPLDHCQVCKCTRLNGLPTGQKTITCYLIPHCRPTERPPLPPTPPPTPPVIDCNRYPENVIFPHPTQPCQACKCSKDYTQFPPVVKVTCFAIPNCGSTPRPPIPPPPPPNDVRCAPLPVGKPFQSPLHPCHICICTETIDIFGKYDVNIDCRENPQCVLPPNATTIVPPVTVTGIPLPQCKNYPENVMFPHPSDPCQMCKCYSEPGIDGNLQQKITCYPKPECGPTTPLPPPPPPPTTPEPASLCQMYPLDQYFPDPYDPCRVCICNKNPFQPHPQITCYLKPGCTRPPAPPTERPPPEHLCDKYPDNVVFPDPLDSCRLCKCYTDPRQGFKRVITCYSVPECQRPTSTPGPNIVSCAPLPVGKPFPSPLNPCQVCVCTETSDMFGRHKVSIECQYNPNCIVPPDVPDIPSVNVIPIPLKLCKYYPQNIFFPHPRDPCSQCRCGIQMDNSGQPLEYITCQAIPNCLPPTPPPTPPTPPTTAKPTVDICNGYPVNIEFVDPSDPCRICVCRYNQPGSAPASWPPRPQLYCKIKSECLPLPPPTTPPTPENICDGHPINIPFEDPRDPCRICVCSYTQPGSAAPPTSWPARPQLYCKTNPKCVPPTPPTTPPSPADVCKGLPLDIPFEDPADPCRICVCTYNVPGGGPPAVFPPLPYLYCKQNPSCVSTPTPPTTPPTPPQNICQNYPVDIPFEDPTDPCRLCVCSYNQPGSGPPISWPPLPQLYCKVNPKCLPPTTPPPTTQNPGNICDSYPIDQPFEDPLDPCRICTCTLNGLAPPGLQPPLYPVRPQLVCRPNPTCKPPQPPTTEHPSNICDNYPINQQFEDPLDSCRICICHVQIGNQPPLFPPRPRLVCWAKPNCEPTPPPLPPTSTENPSNICDSYPVDRPFEDPLDPCRICICTLNGFAPPGHQPQLFPPRPQLICRPNPICIPPPPPTTENPSNICGNYPINQQFDDPLDSCRICTCIVPAGSPLPTQPQLICWSKPNCEPTPPPLPPITEHPSNICDSYPVDRPFEDPLDPCRICTCTLNGLAPPGHQPQLFPPRPQLICRLNPSCAPTPPPTTENPSNICNNYPINQPFEDPLDPCRICTCTLSGIAWPGQPPLPKLVCRIKPSCLPQPPPTTESPSSICDSYPPNQPFEDPRDPCRICTCTLIGSPPGLQPPLFPPLRPQLVCQSNPHCVSTPLPPPPSTTEYPVPDICDRYPLNQEFNDPSDPCLTCKCTLPGLAPPGLQPPLMPPLKPQRVCQLKPHCQPPTEEPIKQVSCKPLPTGVPFQNPLNPCAICVCSEILDANGNVDVHIRCVENPQCVLPPDSSTLPPIVTTETIPLPACKKFPTNVLFPHPTDACKVCKCTVELNPWGESIEHITCYDNLNNPKCSNQPSTPKPPPEPTLCDRYPPNTPFQLPQDPCTLCQCVVENMSLPGSKKLVCYVNPACHPAPPTTTPAPWTGPLPGPGPHESCAPYKPNEPFQHPWDECQICVCREARSLDKVTIEVSCYTSPSCCYEYPYDQPSNGGGSGQPGSPGAGSDGKYRIDWTGSNVIGPTGGNVIKQTGGNVIRYPVRPNNGINGPQNIIEGTGGNIIEGTGENLIGPSGNYYPNNPSNLLPGNLLGPEGGLISPGGGNLNGPSGGSLISPSGGNLIGPTGGNIIGPSGGNLIGPSGGSGYGNLIGPSGGNLIGPSGGNLIGPTGGNLIGPTGGNLIGAPGNNQIGPTGSNIIGPTGGNRITPSGSYRLFPGHPIFRNLEKSSVSGQKNSLHYSLKTEGVSEAKAEASAGLTDTQAAASASASAQQYSTKMRTKSGNPDDENSKDYD